MKRMLLSLFFISTFGQLQMRMSKVHHVKTDARGTGYSWIGTSNNLQQVINVSNAGPLGGVTGQAYLLKIIIGDVNSEPEKAFVLKKEWEIFDCFADNEPLQEDRRHSVIAVRPSILSGDLDGAQIRAG